MKHLLVCSIALVLLGGCVIAPAGYGDHRDGYYQERGYYRGDGTYRDRGYYRGDGDSRDYGYRRSPSGAGDPFQDHGR